MGNDVHEEIQSGLLYGARQDDLGRTLTPNRFLQRYLDQFSNESILRIPQVMNRLDQTDQRLSAIERQQFKADLNKK